MKRSTPLRRYTRLKAKRSKPRNRKTVVRLTGNALTILRLQCWVRDGIWCKECGQRTYWEPRYEGDPQAYDMAHIVSRGAGGSDVLENVRALCHACHMKEHQEGRGSCSSSK